MTRFMEPRLSMETSSSAVTTGCMPRVRAAAAISIAKASALPVWVPTRMFSTLAAVLGAAAATDVSKPMAAREWSPARKPASQARWSPLKGASSGI
ncbi:hypothetical protein D3C80_1034680 [compost metagenome]